MKKGLFSFNYEKIASFIQNIKSGPTNLLVHPAPLSLRQLYQRVVCFTTPTYFEIALVTPICSFNLLLPLAMIKDFSFPECLSGWFRLFHRLLTQFFFVLQWLPLAYSWRRWWIIHWVWLGLRHEHHKFPWHHNVDRSLLWTCPWQPPFLDWRTNGSSGGSPYGSCVFPASQLHWFDVGCTPCYNLREIWKGRYVDRAVAVAQQNHLQKWWKLLIYQL